jgi:hypothetical protein
MEQLSFEQFPSDWLLEKAFEAFLDQLLAGEPTVSLKLIRPKVLH